MNKLYLYIFSFFVLFFISCTSNTNIKIEPINLTNEHSCDCDGMVIVEYKGPKAQILWKNGKRTLYCEVKEAFFEILDDVKGKRVSAIFVQDFSNISWGSYVDKWMKAEDAYYIIDSDKDGAMGITYVPFSIIDEALEFKENNNGKLLNFKDIDIDVLFNSNELMKTRMIS